MRKAAVNNEIVLLRKFVRQARVCVSRKLLREAKALRVKQGDEKQREKNANRADRLISEVLTLKKLKDDDISIFGITNTRSLQTVLQDPLSDERMRILAKVVHYKNLHNKIVEFKGKFPDHESSYRRPKKQNGKKRVVTNIQALGSKNRVEIKSDSDSKQNVCSNDGNDDDDDDNNGDHHEESKDEDNTRSRHENVIEKKRKRNEPSTLVTKKIDTSAREKDDKEIYRQDTETSVKVVSGVATVKRFAELLESQESSESSADHDETALSRVNSEDVCNDIEKESDDFFMTSDGNNAYLSVVVSKANEDIEQIEEDRINTGRWNARIEKRPWNSFEKEGKFIQRQQVTRTSFDLTMKDKRHVNVLNDNVRRRNDTGKGEKESLHPSWEARRKQQEIMKQGFQGKKIIFDDI